MLAGCGLPRSDRPNLLLVTVDTLRADRLGCYGGDPAVGAAICALAAQGVRFDWAFAAAPYTAPSIASILTSRYPTDHGVTQSVVSFLGNDAVTVAELLQAAGYTTAAFISNPALERSRNLGQGFAHWDEEMMRPERNRPHIADRDARSTTDAVLGWARSSAEPPWFIWVHFQDPHGPYTASESDPARDEPGEAKLRVLADHGGLAGIPAYQALPGLYTAGGYERAYLAEIAFLDPEVERLIEALDALGDPPAVLLTADHGEAFGEDGYYFAHGHSVGLDQVRVPLLWRPPHPADPVTVATPVSLLDVAPTLVRVAGLEVPAEFQGRPLPVADGNAAAADPARPIFAEHRWRAAVIVGSAYYAREHREPPRGERDPTSGGPVTSLPRRTARLSEVGPLPAYDNAEGEAARALEPLLAEHLASSEVHAAPRRASVPPETRERLRALGYLD